MFLTAGLIKHLALEGCVPFTPMPSEPALEVAVLPVKEWARRKPLDETPKNPEIKGMTI
jgi:putative transposase